MTNTPASRQLYILNLLRADDILSSGDGFQRYSKKFQKSRRTFTKDWEKANIVHKEYRGKVNAAREDASIIVEVEAVKQGLKSKIDRALFYQNQIDIMEMQLTGAAQFTFIVANKPVKSHNTKTGEFILPIEKQNEIRDQIKSYQTELSKMEGDYITAKFAQEPITAIEITVIRNEIKY